MHAHLVLSVAATDALCSIAHDLILDRTSLLERLKHFEEAIDLHSIAVC